jgi:hypothetical protein
MQRCRRRPTWQILRSIHLAPRRAERRCRVELVAQLVEAIRARPVLGVLGTAAIDDTEDRAETRRTDQRKDLRQPCLTSLGASAPVDRRSASRRGRRNGACGSHRSARGHGLPEIGGCKGGRRGVPFGSSLRPGIRQPRRESSMSARPQCGVEVRERPRRGARRPVGGRARPVAACHRTADGASACPRRRR